MLRYFQSRRAKDIQIARLVEQRTRLQNDMEFAIRQAKFLRGDRDAFRAECERLKTERDVIMRCVTGRPDILQRFVERDILENGPIGRLG